MNRKIFARPKTSAGSRRDRVGRNVGSKGKEEGDVTVEDDDDGGSGMVAVKRGVLEKSWIDESGLGCLEPKMGLWHGVSRNTRYISPSDIVAFMTASG
jgi:hypothetical protein